jgi:predicted N-acetyltransferase YhbS
VRSSSLRLPAWPRRRASPRSAGGAPVEVAVVGPVDEQLQRQGIGRGVVGEGLDQGRRQRVEPLRLRERSHRRYRQRAGLGDLACGGEP